MRTTPELKLRLEPHYALIKESIDSGATIRLELWTYLLESEAQLKDLMNGNPPAEDAPGKIEDSWALYFLNHEAPEWLTKDLRKPPISMPASKIVPGDWEKWEAKLTGEGVLMGDGSFVAYAKYAVADPFWALALFNYLLLELGIIKKHPFGITPACIPVQNKTQLNVALFGDWGTGSYTDGNLPFSPSELIEQQLISMKPDINIHLGDVYYAGTKIEEQDKLVNCWPSAPVANLTLNSNHEMYDGANGLFDIALCAPALSDQQNTTYFQIEYGNWLIVGIDTAYYDQSSMFMDGTLVDTNQIAFLQKAGASGKKICLLSHHNPIDTTGHNKVFHKDPNDPTGTNLIALWDQVVNALGKEPDYWYWGHIHNGIVYTPASAGGTVNCRCLGNAAIPIGDASWLANSPSTVSYYTHTKLPNPTTQQQLRVQNGFAILEFTIDAITEKWYNQDGTLAWSS
jgi:hypothetical protein